MRHNKWYVVGGILIVLLLTVAVLLIRDSHQADTARTPDQWQTTWNYETTPVCQVGSSLVAQGECRQLQQTHSFLAGVPATWGLLPSRKYTWVNGNKVYLPGASVVHRTNGCETSIVVDNVIVPHNKIITRPGFTVRHSPILAVTSPKGAPQLWYLRNQPYSAIRSYWVFTPTNNPKYAFLTKIVWAVQDDPFTDDAKDRCSPMEIQRLVRQANKDVRQVAAKVSYPAGS